MGLCVCTSLTQNRDREGAASLPAASFSLRILCGAGPLACAGTPSSRFPRWSGACGSRRSRPRGRPRIEACFDYDAANLEACTLPVHETGRQHETRAYDPQTLHSSSPDHSPFHGFEILYSEFRNPVLADLSAKACSDSTACAIQKISEYALSFQLIADFSTLPVRWVHQHPGGRAFALRQRARFHAHRR